MAALRRTVLAVTAVAVTTAAPAFAATQQRTSGHPHRTGCAPAAPATVSRSGPGHVQLLLSSQQQTPFLRTRDAPLPSGRFTVLPLQPVVFVSNQLHRPLTITGPACLRLHVDHYRQAPAHLSLTLDDVAGDGTTRALARAALTVPATVSPARILDLRLATTRGHRLATGHTLQLTVALAATDVDQVHVYYGGQAGECSSGDTAGEFNCGNGGADPARLDLPLRNTYGAFSAW